MGCWVGNGSSEQAWVAPLSMAARALAFYIAHVAAPCAINKSPDPEPGPTCLCSAPFYRWDGNEPTKCPLQNSGRKGRNACGGRGFRSVNRGRPRPGTVEIPYNCTRWSHIFISPLGPCLVYLKTKKFSRFPVTSNLVALA